MSVLEYPRRLRARTDTWVASPGEQRESNGTTRHHSREISFGGLYHEDCYGIALQEVTDVSPKLLQARMRPRAFLSCSVEHVLAQANCISAARSYEQLGRTRPQPPSVRAERFTEAASCVIG